MEKEIRYVNHEKVMLLQEYEKVLAENREFLLGRSLVAFNLIKIEEKKIEEERELMLDVITNFENLFDKHLCKLNNDFWVKAKLVLDETKIKLSEKWDSVASMINLVLGSTIQIDWLSLDFRNNFYKNLK